VLCPDDCARVTLAVCGNTVCETADGENCVTCPADCNGKLSGSPADRYCCSNGGVSYAVGCLFPACTANGNTCTSLAAPESCCGDGSCQGQESSATCLPDCGAATPGEAGDPASGMLLVTAWDAAGEKLSFTYSPACAAGTHVIAWGELTAASLASYAWAGRECEIGTAGAHEWTVTGLPDSLFFVVVGQGGGLSGSYGLDGDGLERVGDVSAGPCLAPQDLFRRCD
jgi:hypothetical protein